VRGDGDVLVEAERHARSLAARLRLAELAVGLPLRPLEELDARPVTRSEVLHLAAVVAAVRLGPAPPVP
jgi:hypothetical protein